MNRIKMNDEHGNEIDVTYQVLGDRVWFYCNGTTWDVKMGPKKGSAQRRHDTAAVSNNIVAPMPGKITKILLEAGQNVTVHQPVVLMEAMKMEYTLKSSVAGSIKKILVAPGAQVVLEQMLVEISPEGEKN